MDSHSFRVAGTELLALLAGARVEKIHAPCPGTLACTLFAGEKKRILLLRHGRQAPLLFFTEERPANPLRPPALVMRLRKYCAGRRLGEGRMDYAARVLAFPVLVPPREPARWLLLDMARGAAVHEELPPAFGAVPAWPDAELTDSLCAVPWRKGEKDGPWRDYPVLTPLLRETLAALDPMEGRALLMDLEAGGGELFFYADAENKPALYAAWPLPARVLARRELFPRPLPESAKSAVPGYPALATVSLVDGSKFFADPGLSGRKKEELPERRAAKKRNRLLAAWDRERERLSAMLALREDALRIQRELWRYPPEAKLDELRMEDEEEEGGPARVIPLNPSLTLRENMARMFRQSARGARGLALLEERRAGFLTAASGAGAVLPVADATWQSGTARREEGAGSEAGRKRREGDGAGRKEEKDVARFLSSDGFLLLRGRNARGNRLLLKMGRPFDLWLHAEDGPGAHLIIRLSHAAEAPPESTLREAAILAGEKSWQRHEAEACVMVARLRHVHAVKGAEPGTVRVDRVELRLRVSLNDALTRKPAIHTQ